MKRTIIYSSIAALLVIIFIFQETAGGGKNTLEISSLPDTLDSIILSRDGETLELQAPSDKSGENFEGWTVGPENYPADRILISDLVTAVNNTGTKEIISSREGYGKYGLEEADVRTMQFFSGGRKVLELKLGDKASLGGSVYALIDDRREVVLLPQSVSDQFSLDPFEFREKQVESLSQDEISRVVIQKTGGADLRISRNDSSLSTEATGENDENEGESPETEWKARYAGAAEDEEIDPGRFRDFFTELADLRAADFPEDSPSGSPWLELTVHLISGDPVIVSLWPPDEGGSYPVRVSTNPYSFTLPQWKARRLVLGIDSYFEAFEE